MKRFVIEAYNHFIKDCEAIAKDNAHKSVKREYAHKIEQLNTCRNAYIIGLITEREAVQLLERYI